MNLAYIVAPLVGGVIGYVTNDLAIRMLFRPHTAKYLFGMHIPFTPGIIPKEKSRIAQAIGEVISENLMNQEVLQQYLLSDGMVSKLRTTVTQFVDSQRTNPETVAQSLARYLSDQEIQGVADDINRNLTGQIHGKISDPAVGDSVAHLAMQRVIASLSEEELDDSLLGVPKLLGKRILGSILSALQGPAERMLSKNIHDILQNNGPEIVSNLIGSEVQNLLDTPVERLLQGKDALLDKVPDKAEELYRMTITEHLPKILQTLDISKIVCDRINEMDMVETERIILQVMKKELRAIVWLGAGLGFLLGFVNAFIK